MTNEPKPVSKLHFVKPNSESRLNFAVNRELRKVKGGFQLWQSTDTPAQPISPVFSTADALCAWAADNATTFADFKATKEEWCKLPTE